ncbi:MAG: family 10 glycosylhydrolase [Chloroflexota bacterium]
MKETSSRKTRQFGAKVLLIVGIVSLPMITISILGAQELDRFTYAPMIIFDATPTPTPTPTDTPSPTPTLTLPPTVTPTPSPTPEGGVLTEFRGVWVSRFDWTSSFSGANEAKIEEIVDNAAFAGFNVIFFQVRGEADAFYTPGLEPWSDRMTGGNLGDDPGWDPLAKLIELAHAEGIQVHAYLNIYPIILGCEAPADGTTPRHLYYGVIDAHGVSNGNPSGLQWTSTGTVHCAGGEYQRVSPASVYFDNHLLSVATDIVQRYDVDGIHLDHIRYARGGSFDPVSQSAYAVDETGLNYDDWQRRQVNGTVFKFYEQIVPLKEDLWLSAAVWPMYIDYWGWGGGEGYYDYYQDSKFWLEDGFIDSISPMIYPAQFNCPDNSFWSQSRWETLVRDFDGDNAGRYVIPGIGTGYCSFDEIEARINKAREIGTAGHALFSYRSLLTNSYFDDLRNGPYAQPAVVPEITWHD